MPVHIDLAVVSSSGRLRRRTPLGASCVEIAKSDGNLVVRTHVFLAIWFQRDHYEALLCIAIMGYIFYGPW
jgi:hypothetical protein